MDSCDLTGEGCVWSSAPAAAGHGSTGAPAAEADVQAAYECTKSLSDEPYKPLSYQQQQLGQPCTPADEQQKQQQQQHSSFVPYRPLGSLAQSQPAPYQPLTQNMNYQQQQQLQYARHTSSSSSSSSNGSSTHSGSVGCQPVLLHNSSTGSVGLWQQQKQQQHNAGLSASTVQAQQQWKPPTQQQPPASHGYNTSKNGYNNTYSNGSGSRGFNGRSYQNGGSWGQMRTGSPGGYNSNSGRYNSRCNSGYNNGYSRGGGSRYGSPGGLAPGVHHPDLSLALHRG